MINGETVQIYCSISQAKFNVSKIHLLRDAAFGTDCLTPFKILKIVIVGSKMILIMLPRIATCCKNFQSLIRSPL